MAISMPPELDWVFEMTTGQAWPKGDEDRLRMLGQVWEQHGQQLTALIGQVDPLTRGVLESMSGAPNTAFANFITSFKTNLPQMAQAAGQIGTMAKDSAAEVEYAKMMIVFQLALLAYEIAMFIAEAPETFGASLALIPPAVAATRAIVMMIARRLLMAIVEQTALMVGMDAIIQGLQMLTGDRSHWNVNNTIAAAAGGAISGLTGGLFHGIGGVKFPKFTNSFGGHITGGAINGLVTTGLTNLMFHGDNSLGWGTAAGAFGGAFGKRGGGGGAGNVPHVEVHVPHIETPHFDGPGPNGMPHVPVEPPGSGTHTPPPVSPNPSQGGGSGNGSNHETPPVNQGAEPPTTRGPQTSTGNQQPAEHQPPTTGQQAPPPTTGGNQAPPVNNAAPPPALGGNGGANHEAPPPIAGAIPPPSIGGGQNPSQGGGSGPVSHGNQPPASTGNRGLGNGTQPPTRPGRPAPPVTSAPPPVQHQGPPLEHQAPPVVHQEPPPVLHQPPPVVQSPPPVVHQSPPVENQAPPVVQGPPPVVQSPPPVVHQPPPVVQSPPPVVHQAPPVENQAPPVVQSPPPVVQSPPPVVHQPPPVVQSPPPVVHQVPPVENQAPPVVQQSPPPEVQQSPPPVVHQSPPVVHQAPPPVEHQSPPVQEQGPPPVAQQGPPVVQQAPPPVRQSPPVAEQSPPPAVRQSPPPVVHQSPPVEHQAPPVEQQGPPPVVQQGPPPVPHQSPPGEHQAPPPSEHQAPPPVQQQGPPVVQQGPPIGQGGPVTTGGVQNGGSQPGGGHGTGQPGGGPVPAPGPHNSGLGGGDKAGGNVGGGNRTPNGEQPPVRGPGQPPTKPQGLPGLDEPAPPPPTDRGGPNTSTGKHIPEPPPLPPAKRPRLPNNTATSNPTTHGGGGGLPGGTHRPTQAPGPHENQQPHQQQPHDNNAQQPHTQQPHEQQNNNNQQQGNGGGRPWLRPNIGHGGPGHVGSGRTPWRDTGPRGPINDRYPGRYGPEAQYLMNAAGSWYHVRGLHESNTQIPDDLANNRAQVRDDLNNFLGPHNMQVRAPNNHEPFIARTGQRLRPYPRDTYANFVNYATGHDDGGAGVAHQLDSWTRGNTNLSALPQPIQDFAVITHFAEPARGYEGPVRQFDENVAQIQHMNPDDARNHWQQLLDDENTWFWPAGRGINNATGPNVFHPEDTSDHSDSDGDYPSPHDSDDDVTMDDIDDQPRGGTGGDHHQPPPPGGTHQPTQAPPNTGNHGGTQGNHGGAQDNHSGSQGNHGGGQNNHGGNPADMPPPHSFENIRQQAPPTDNRGERFEADVHGPDGHGLLSGWITHIGYQQRRFQLPDGSWVRDYEVGLNLRPGPGVSQHEINQMQQQLNDAVNQHLNQQYRMPNGDQFNVTLNFHPTDPHGTVTVHHGSGTDQSNFSTSAPNGHLVHEILHYLGLSEGYKDPNALLNRPIDHTGPMGHRASTGDFTVSDGQLHRIDDIGHHGPISDLPHTGQQPPANVHNGQTGGEGHHGPQHGQSHEPTPAPTQPPPSIARQPQPANEVLHGSHDFQRNLGHRDVTMVTKDTWTGPPLRSTPDTSRPAYVATVPVRAGTDLGPIVDRYQQAISNPDGRFALVFAVNGTHNGPGAFDTSDIQRQVDALRARPDLNFPVGVVGFSWHHPQAHQPGHDPSGQDVLPYGIFREIAARNPLTESAIETFGEHGGTVYLHTGDHDAMSLNLRNGTGLFDAADNYLTKHQPDVFSGGYRVGGGNGIGRDAGVLDQIARGAMSTVDPKSVYFPEPNTFIRVPPGHSGLPTSYTFGMGRNEGQTLVNSIGNHHGGTQVARFNPNLSVETDGGRITSKLDDSTTGFDRIGEATNLVQSHANQDTWRKQMDQYLAGSHGIYGDGARQLANEVFEGLPPHNEAELGGLTGKSVADLRANPNLAHLPEQALKIGSNTRAALIDGINRLHQKYSNEQPSGSHRPTPAPKPAETGTTEHQQPQHQPPGEQHHDQRPPEQEHQQRPPEQQREHQQQEPPREQRPRPVRHPESSTTGHHQRLEPIAEEHQSHEQRPRPVPHEAHREPVTDHPLATDEHPPPAPPLVRESVPEFVRGNHSLGLSHVTESTGGDEVVHAARELLPVDGAHRDRAQGLDTIRNAVHDDLDSLLGDGRRFPVTVDGRPYEVHVRAELDLDGATAHPPAGTGRSVDTNLSADRQVNTTSSKSEAIDLGADLTIAPVAGPGGTIGLKAPLAHPVTKVESGLGIKDTRGLSASNSHPVHTPVRFHVSVQDGTGVHHRTTVDGAATVELAPRGTQAPHAEPTPLPGGTRITQFVPEAVTGTHGAFDLVQHDLHPDITKLGAPGRSTLQQFVHPRNIRNELGSMMDDWVYSPELVGTGGQSAVVRMRAVPTDASLVETSQQHTISTGGKASIEPGRGGTSKSGLEGNLGLGGAFSTGLVRGFVGATFSAKSRTTLDSKVTEPVSGTNSLSVDGTTLHYRTGLRIEFQVVGHQPAALPATGHLRMSPNQADRAGLPMPSTVDGSFTRSPDGDPPPPAYLRGGQSVGNNHVLDITGAPEVLAQVRTALHNTPGLQRFVRPFEEALGKHGTALDNDRALQSQISRGNFSARINSMLDGGLSVTLKQRGWFTNDYVNIRIRAGITDLHHTGEAPNHTVSSSVSKDAKVVTTRTGEHGWSAGIEGRANVLPHTGGTPITAGGAGSLKYGQQHVTKESAGPELSTSTGTSGDKRTHAYTGDVRYDVDITKFSRLRAGLRGITPDLPGERTPKPETIWRTQRPGETGPNLLTPIHGSTTILVPHGALGDGHPLPPASNASTTRMANPPATLADLRVTQPSPHGEPVIEAIVGTGHFQRAAVSALTEASGGDGSLGSRGTVSADQIGHVFGPDSLRGSNPYRGRIQVGDSGGLQYSRRVVDRFGAVGMTMHLSNPQLVSGPSEIGIKHGYTGGQKVAGTEQHGWSVDATLGQASTGTPGRFIGAGGLTASGGYASKHTETSTVSGAAEHTWTEPGGRSVLVRMDVDAHIVAESRRANAVYHGSVTTSGRVVHVPGGVYLRVSEQAARDLGVLGPQPAPHGGSGDGALAPPRGLTQDGRVSLGSGWLTNPPDLSPMIGDLRGQLDAQHLALLPKSVLDDTMGVGRRLDLLTSPNGSRALLENAFNGGASLLAPHTGHVSSRTYQLVLHAERTGDVTFAGTDHDGTNPGSKVTGTMAGGKGTQGEWNAGLSARFAPSGKGGSLAGDSHDPTGTLGGGPSASVSHSNGRTITTTHTDTTTQSSAGTGPVARFTVPTRFTLSVVRGGDVIASTTADHDLTVGQHADDVPTTGTGHPSGPARLSTLAQGNGTPQALAGWRAGGSTLPSTVEFTDFGGRVTDLHAGARQALAAAGVPTGFSAASDVQGHSLAAAFDPATVRATLPAMLDGTRPPVGMHSASLVAGTDAQVTAHGRLSNPRLVSVSDSITLSGDRNASTSTEVETSARTSGTRAFGLPAAATAKQPAMSGSTGGPSGTAGHDGGRTASTSQTVAPTGSSKHNERTVLVTFDLDVRFVAQVHNRLPGTGPDRTGVSEVQVPGGVTVRMPAADAARLIGDLPNQVSTAQDRVHTAAEQWRTAEQTLQQQRAAVDDARTAANLAPRDTPPDEQGARRLVEQLDARAAAARTELARAQEQLVVARYLTAGDPSLDDAMGVGAASDRVRTAQSTVDSIQRERDAAENLAGAHAAAEHARTEAQQARQNWWQAKSDLNTALSTRNTSTGSHPANGHGSTSATPATANGDHQNHPAPPRSPGQHGTTEHGGPSGNGHSTGHGSQNGHGGTNGHRGAGTESSTTDSHRSRPAPPRTTQPGSHTTTNGPGRTGSDQHYEAGRQRAPYRTVRLDDPDVLRQVPRTHPDGRPAELGHVNGRIHYDLRRMETEPGTWVTEHTVRLHLQPGQDVTAQDLATARSRIESSVDSAFNDRYTLPGSGDRLRVRVEFTDDPATAHETVAVHRTGPVDQHRFPLDATDHEYAHEIGHYLGLPDRYDDGPHGNQDPGRPVRVFNSDDGRRARNLDGGTHDLRNRIDDGTSPMGAGIAHPVLTFGPHDLSAIEDIARAHAAVPDTGHDLFTGHTPVPEGLHQHHLPGQSTSDTPAFTGTGPARAVASALNQRFGTGHDSRDLWQAVAAEVRADPARYLPDTEGTDAFADQLASGRDWTRQHATVADAAGDAVLSRGLVGTTHPEHVEPLPQHGSTAPSRPAPVSYLTPSRPVPPAQLTSHRDAVVMRGEFRVEQVGDEHYVRLYTTVYAPTRITDQLASAGPLLSHTDARDQHGDTPDVEQLAYKDVQQLPDGTVVLNPGRNGAFWVGGGVPFRQVRWYTNYLHSNNSAPVVRSYLVPLHTFQQLSRGAVPEAHRTGGANRDRTFNVDRRSAPNQFGVVGPDLAALAGSVLPGSLRTYVADPATFDAGHAARSGEVRPMSELYAEIGAPMADLPPESVRLSRPGSRVDAWVTRAAEVTMTSARNHALIAAEFNNHYVTWLSLRGNHQIGHLYTEHGRAMRWVALAKSRLPADLGKQLTGLLPGLTGNHLARIDQLRAHFAGTPDEAAVSAALSYALRETDVAELARFLRHNLVLVQQKWGVGALPDDPVAAQVVRLLRAAVANRTVDEVVTAALDPAAADPAALALVQQYVVDVLEPWASQAGVSATIAELTDEYDNDQSIPADPAELPYGAS